MSEEEIFKKLEKAMEGKSSYKDIIIENQQKKIDKYREILDKIKERHWKTRRNYVEDLTKLYDKLSELLEEIE